jgi:hypothetical protein
MNFCLNLDLNKNITLGGALTVRAECEILFRKFDFDEIFIKFHKEINAKKKSFLLDSIFQSSAYKYEEISDQNKAGLNWPPENLKLNKNFEFHSFDRLVFLFKKYNLYPFLFWDEKIKKSAEKKMPINNTTIFVHTKYVSPYLVEESNTDWIIWEEFFELMYSLHPDITFCLMGDDSIGMSIEHKKNIVIAKNKELLLNEQLYLASQSAGFLGMASGVCCAANFSKVPYVIFKHPEHHKREMLDELGQNETYEFSHSCQRLLRSNQSLDLFTQSFNMIKEYNEFKKN